MNQGLQFVGVVAVAVLAAACGASRQPMEPSTPAESEQGQPMPGMSQAEHEAMGQPPASSEATPVPPDSGSQPATSMAPAQDPLEAERVAYERAQPVFQEHCAKCHTTEGKRASKGALKHFNMDGYPLAGHHAAEVAATIREALGVIGGDATMPKDRPGAVRGEQLALVTTWADAFDRAHAAGVHAGAADSGKAGDGHGDHAH